MRNKRPIGVFDSGLGGLTIVREIRRRLPRESIVYFGDIARLPYGIKSKSQILRYSLQNTEFLLKQRVKAVIIACNSSSGAAFPALRNKYDVPVLDVIHPAVREASVKTRTGRVGVIATNATIASKAYEKALRKNRAGTKVYSRACPLFVPLVEEGWLGGPVARGIALKYLEPLRKKKIDTLILGCTHYPLLASLIQGIMGKSVHLIDSAGPTVAKLAVSLNSLKLINPGSSQGALSIFVSDKPRNFVRIGQRFLKEKMTRVKLMRIA